MGKMEMPERYLARADETEKLARRTTSVKLRETLLLMAQHYRDFAKDEEARSDAKQREVFLAS